ncbi:MAG: hypothetical protein ACXAC2_00430 [Candidatus Kariarchaeaceae archaeon]|jgi:hypothetical protein
MSKDEKSDKDSINVASSLPPNLFARMTKIIKDEGMKGNAEFIRSAIIRECYYWEKQEVGREIWKQIGIPILEKIKKDMDEKVKELENSIDKVHQGITDVKKDQEIKKEVDAMEEITSVDEDDENEDNDDDDIFGT